MRIRTIKPEFWTHRMHRRLDGDTVCVAIALLNYADDEGRFEADAELFKAACFPLRGVDVAAAWRKLEAEEWVGFYEGKTRAGKPVRFGVVINFKVHQVINRPSPSCLPPPPPEFAPLDFDALLDSALAQQAAKPSRPPKPAAPSTADDEAWLASLASDPANAGIDVQREFAKCRMWCSTHGKQLTRRRFTNWLLRSERPMKANGPNPSSGPATRNSYVGTAAEHERMQARLAAEQDAVDDDPAAGLKGI